MNTPVLLLIDIQKDYFPGGSMPLSGPEDAASAAARVLEHFRARDWPRIHVRHDSTNSSVNFMRPGTPGHAFHPDVEPLPGERVIGKNFPDAFQATALQETLNELRAQRLVIAGMMTHMCIDTTVRSAFSRGFPVDLIADATASRELVHGDTRVPADMVQAAFLAALGARFSSINTASAWLDKSGAA